MKKPEEKPISFCMAPWVHTYISPQTERRLCCASREPAQAFKQYIDTEAGTGEYDPLTLETWWNSEHVKSVRRRMMAGEELDECQVCNHKLLNVHVYRDYFWMLFRHHYDKVWEQTDETGYTSMQPISWDYRISNLCNFKCRMCGDMLSSSWETEEKKNNLVLYDNPKNLWMRKDIRTRIQTFQNTTVANEMRQAIEDHRVEEIYWVGGEPLMYEEHWEFMNRIIELGDGGKVYARYNTNLSRVEYRGHRLFDILNSLRDWEICASIDGTGKIGEYIRTGLHWTTFLENYKAGVKAQKHPWQMRLDFTLTLPGMFEIENMISLAEETDTNILAKVVFSFTPDIILSPLSIPKEILHPWLDETIMKIQNRPKGQPIIDVLQQLKNRPTFAEQWPNEYKQGLQQGKDRALTLERIRKDSFTLRDILSEKPELIEWWDNIND